MANVKIFRKNLKTEIPLRIYFLEFGHGAYIGELYFTTFCTTNENEEAN
jgi:hypothetical protein